MQAERINSPEIEIEDLALQKLCDGEVIEEIDAKLRELQRDIGNKRKVAKATRELVIKIRFKTDERQCVYAIESLVSTKLAPFDVDEGDRWFSKATTDDRYPFGRRR